MRKDIFEYVKLIKKQGDEKINFSKIAKMFDCDYRTVKKYFTEEEITVERKKQPSKLDGFKERIADKVKLGCTYYSIYQMIKKEGYLGKYSILANYCKSINDEEKKKATIRFETIPGQQAQVDWKESMTLHTRSGATKTFNIFLMLLGYSRCKYIELTLDRSQDTLESAMIRGLDYFGGVPKEIIFDNMRTVVDQSKTNYREAVINEKFYQFSKDVGFEVWACRPYRPQTKGKVEALARTMERLRPYDYEFDTLDELDEIINELRSDLNSEVSQATNQKPIDLLEKEKEYLLPLPPIDTVETYLTIPLTRKVSKESMVVYNKRKYSLPTDYIGKTVEIKEENGILSIVYCGRLITTHEITDKKYNYKYEHMVDILRSDAMRFSKASEIEEIAKRNLQIYDGLGG